MNWRGSIGALPIASACSGKQAQSVDRDKLDQTLLRLALPARDVRRLKRFAQRELPKTATNAAVIERLSAVLEAADPDRI